MDELRSWFEVPAIAHYFHVFRDAFDLIDFDIEDFEETLLVDGSNNVSSFIPDIVIRLLRGLYKTKDGLQVTFDNHGHYLHDLLNFHYGVLQKKENPLINSTFKELSTRQKVEIIHDMINWRLDLEDAMELTKNLEAEEMRVEPVGKDSEGSVYWYFYGSRLYKEGGSVVDDSQDEAEAAETKPKKAKKRKKKPVAQTRSGRAIRKRKNSSSEGSGEESEKSVEIPDDDLGTPKKKPSSKNTWSVVCSTNEMWRTLMDSLRGTTSRNEKQLLANVEELYTNIPTIIKARDEKVQRKMLAMAPRRVSDRVSYRMQLKEEEERTQEHERLLKKEQKAKEDEERQKKIEAEKAEEREKRYKEREKMLEQRAMRAKMREEQKHVRVNPEIAGYSPAPSTPNSMIKAEMDKSLSSETEEEEEEDNEFTSMSIVLEAIKEHDDAWLFLQPVKEEEAPNYYTYIKNPMDFQTIGEKIKAKVYKDKYEFENDVLLVFDNCETYNGTYSPFTKLAFKVKKQFHKVMKREFPKDIHEDDDDFFQSDDQPSKPKKSRLSKSISPPQLMAKGHLQQQLKKERKPRKEKVFPSVPSDSSTPKMPAARAKPIHHIYQKPPPVTQLSPISATNFLSTRFGIPPNVLKQMSPAQMQSLILRYPRAGFVPALQGLMGHKLHTSPGNTGNSSSVGGSTGNVVVGTTTLSPLHQLANTALAPAPAPSVSIALPILPKSVPPGASIMNKAQQAIRPFNPGQVQSTLGRPRKTSIAPAVPVVTTQQAVSGGYVSGLSVSGVPVTIQWDELKKQLMAQMVPTASATTTSAVAQSSKYVSGVTVSGAPITIEWEELKKQLVTQMKKDENPTLPLNKENIAMSLLHLNSGANTIVSMAAPSTTMSGIPSLNVVTMASAGSMAGIPSLRPNIMALAAASGIPNLHSNVVTIVQARSAHSVIAAAGMSVTPNIIRPNSGTMASANAIPGIPGLRPVSIPAAVPLRFTKDVGAATTTTPASTKMFSFSNILNNKGPTASPAKPVTIKTPTFDTTTSATSVENNVAKTTATVSPLSGVKLQSGHAKVQDWLHSSSPFIVQNTENSQSTSKVTSTIQTVISGDSGVFVNGKTPSLRFISTQVPPQASTLASGNNSSVPMEYIPRPSFLTSTNVTSASKLVPIALPNVHHIVTTISNNGINIIPIKSPIASQGKIVAASAANLAAVASKSNLLDLQKAALQAAAVNQISSKLQNHLKKDQMKNKPELFNYVIKDTTSLAASASAAKPAPRKAETLTFLNQNEVIMSSSNIVAANQMALNVAPSVLLNQFNNIPANQLLTSANLLTSSGAAGSVPVGQPRILIMPNRSISETPPTAVTFPATGLVNIQPGRPVSSTVLPSDALASKVQLVNPALPSTGGSFPFVRSPIPIQIPQSLNNQIISTLVPTTKYVTFAPKPVAGQPASQLSKIIVPSVPALSKITPPQTVRFQTISSDVPVIQPKTNSTNKQFVVQQRTPGQGQTVRYILPAQTQLPGGQIINLNQLGSVQNLFINNVPIVKNPTTKSVRIVSGNLSNGIGKSTGNKILVTPALGGVNKLTNGATAAVLANAAQVKATEAIVMRSPVKVGITPDDIRPQLSLAPTASPVFTISNVHPKKLDSNQTLVIANNTLTNNTSGVNNLISIPRQTAVPLRPNVVQKIEVNTPNGSIATVRHPLMIQPTPKLDATTIIRNNNNISTIRQTTVSAISDARKLLPKTTISSSTILMNGFSTPNATAAVAATTTTTQSSPAKSPPDGGAPKTAEKQKHIVLDPTQLQKLKEEGRIIMTPTGQLIMIPPNLVGKVPGSVFK